MRNARTSALRHLVVQAPDWFTLSTMPAADATKDVLIDYAAPAEMIVIGELVGGKPHIRAVMAIGGDRAVSGHLHRARIGTHFARACLLPAS